MEMNKALVKIQELMDERKWTIYKLAKEANIPYSSLNSLFLKNNQPTISTLEKICSGFHITMSEFFEEDTPYRVQSYQFSEDELSIIEMYQSLNQHNKRLLLAYIKGFVHRPL